MKKLLLPSLMLIVIACTKITYGPEPSSQNELNGPVVSDAYYDVEFHSNKPLLMLKCGPITIKLNTGEEKKNYGAETYGGDLKTVFHLLPGEYKYTITSVYGCKLGSGKFVVDTELNQIIEF